MISKQKAIILILVIFFVTFGALLWFYFSTNIGSSKQVKIPTPIDIYDPFGTSMPTDIILPASSTPEVTNATSNNYTTPNKLRLISEEPISGFSITENSQTKNTDVHFILRANGNIYETYTNSPEIRRLSITTIPKVYDSLWLPDGQRLIIRYLKDISEDIETFSVKINPATTTLNEFKGGVDGNHLPENISDLAINPRGDKVFYLTDNLNGSTGYTARPDDQNKKLLFESPLIEWLVSWPKEEIITLNTKASAKIPGYLFFLNSQTGNFTRILGEINGLTTKTNKTATEVLYSDSGSALPKLSLYNIKSGESKLLPWATFPEKCLWSNTDAQIVYCAVPKSFPVGEYPDLWYQGLINFTDDIWMINTDTQTTTLVFDAEQETKNSFDIINISTDINDNYLFFMNKVDLSFWSLNLK